MNKKYWLRGGIIGVIVYVIGAISLFIPIPTGILIVPIGLVIMYVTENYSSSATIILTMISGLILYCLIGMICGLVYGKIKQRSRLVSQ